MGTREHNDDTTAWGRNLATPVRSFLSTETGGAAVVLAGVVAALIWANVSGHSYSTLWGTRLDLRIGSHGLSAPLRTWINQGLMSLFFLVVGLEAKRQLDLGELRDRQRLIVPALAALCGLAIPAGIYLALNAGWWRGGSLGGWGAAISTDTAFALSVVGLIASRAATRLRVFLLSLAVVDDLLSLAVIAVAYTRHVSVVALAIAVGLFLVLLALRWAPTARAPLAVLVGLGVWLAMFRSGIDPVTSGLAIGLVTSAYPPRRESLAEVLDLTRSFREQPTPELARAAQRSLGSSLSANERLQHDLHPWTSYVIVPLFALANAGVTLSGHLLSAAAHSPITLGILGGYVLGKPVGVRLGTWIATRPALHGPRSPISGPVVLIGGATAGTGFTVSFLIAGLAFQGDRLAEAKLGTLCTLVLAPALAYAFRFILNSLSAEVRSRQLAGTAEDILDLADDVDLDRDHIRGSSDAMVTLLEYGDFECPFCGQAETAVRAILERAGEDVRYVWRHLPLNDVHPHAQLAAEASEAAADQGRFWEMYDLLMAHQGALDLDHLAGYAESLDLDVDAFIAGIRERAWERRVEDDVSSADESGVSGTPTFFIDGRRHYGVYDAETLIIAVRGAKRRALARRATGVPA